MRKLILGVILMCFNMLTVNSLGGHIGTWQYWVVLICTALYGLNMCDFGMDVD